MKKGTKPTVKQKKLLAAKDLDYNKYLLVKTSYMKKRSYFENAVAYTFRNIDDNSEIILCD